NSSGVLTRQSIETAMLDPRLGNGPGAAYLTALHNQFSGLTSVVDQERAGGITLHGLARMLRSTNTDDLLTSQDRRMAMAELSSNFDLLNSERENSPDTITIAEVDAALRRTDTTDRQRQALRDLREHMDSIRTGGITRGVIAEGNALVSPPSPETGEMRLSEFSPLAPESARVFASLDRSIQRARTRLEQADAPGGRDRIAQGVDGTCFFMASLASLQATNPSIMQDMIRDNRNGTYTVTFPGDSRNPITVNAPTRAEMANWGNGLNAGIMERAFANLWAARHPDQATDSRIPAARVPIGQAAEALQVLTGRTPGEFQTSDHSEAELRTLLQQSSTAFVADTSSRTALGVGLAQNHSYSVRFDADRNEVILQNPVRPDGPNVNTSNYPLEPHRFDGRPLDGTDDGSFRMPLAAFRQQFARIHHAQPAAAVRR
ncbi:MAG: hypothetical protein K2Z81_16075, partial [Cyanobacteria bacterium]|nr:hypothetical protein [Cyanobacteriota bacterium]